VFVATVLVSIVALLSIAVVAVLWLNR